MSKRSPKHNQRESDPITRREVLVYAGLAGAAVTAFYRAGLFDLLFGHSGYKEKKKKGIDEGGEEKKNVH